MKKRDKKTDKKALRKQAADRARERAKKRQKEATGKQTLNFTGEKFKPSKRCTIDILPYKVTDKHHPDAKPGEEWYHRPFKTHKNIGGQTIVCPTSVGKKCPVCEEVNRLRAKYNDNKDRIGEIRAKDRELFNVFNHKTNRIELWNESIHLFGKQLDIELDEGEEHWGAFYLPGDLGLSLALRFTERKSEFGDFLEVNRIDFVERDDPYDEKLLDDVYDLDKIIADSVLSYKEIENLMMEVDSSEDEDDDTNTESDDDEDEEEKEKESSEDSDDDEDEDEDSDDDEEEEEEEDDEDDDDEEEEEEPEEKPVKKDKKEAKPAKKDKKPDKPERSRRNRTEKKSGGKGKCPSGGTFGKDCDKLKQCDDCPEDVWEKCAKAQDEEDD